MIESMDLAVIQDGVVVNVIVGDADTLANGVGSGFTVVTLPEGIGIGWTYDGQTFAAPSLTIPEEP